VASEKILLQVAWGPRKESSAEVAERWLAMQQRLTPLAPDLLGRWVHGYETADGKLAEQELADLETLQALVEHGAHHKDDPPDEVIAELGYQLSASNGRGGGPGEVGFVANAGLHTDLPGLMNQARLEAYPGSDELPRWAALAEPVLTALVAAWEPDYGQVWTWSVREPQDPQPRQPFAGYVTYLSPGRRRYLTSELPAATRELADGGLLVSVIGPDGAFGSPDDVAAVGATLRESGAFAPTPTDRPQL
jgi:hypothetical protein